MSRKRPRAEEGGGVAAAEEEESVWMCLICHEPMLVPCKPMFGCTDCPVRACHHCLIKYFMLDRMPQQRVRSGIASAKCLLCDRRADMRQTEDKLMFPDTYLMRIMDMEGRELQCSWCKAPTSSHLALLRHVQTMCPRYTVPCSWCELPVAREDQVSHIDACVAAERCGWCKKKIVRREWRQCHMTLCPERGVRCTVCAYTTTLSRLAAHIALHSGEIERSAETHVRDIIDHDDDSTDDDDEDDG